MTKSLVTKFANALTATATGTPPVQITNRYSTGMFSLNSPSAMNETYLRAFGASGTIFSIVSTLATAVAMPEWHLYRNPPQDGRRRYTTGDKGSDQRTEVVNNAALSLWQMPNDYTDRFEFTEACQQHLELCGEAWWVLGRAGGPGTMPISMWYVRPDRMQPVPSDDGYLHGYVYTSPTGEQVPLDLQDVILVKYPNPMDPLRGMGPVQSILPDIQAMRYAAEFNKNFFLNGASPSGVITFDKRLSDPEWDEFTDRWREQHQGVARANRVAVLENGAQWADAKLAQKDMDFVNLIESSRDLLREAWGLHKSMLGNSDDVNRANAQTAEEVFGSWKVIPRLNRIRQAANLRLLPQYGKPVATEFDYDNPLPDDREADNAELAAKATAAQLLVNAGFDPSDVLETVGLPDMDVVEKATQLPALPPGFVPAPPAAPPAAPDTSDEQLNNELVRLVNDHWARCGATAANCNGHAKAGV